MWTPINVSEEEYLQDAMPMITDFQKYLVDLGKQHDNTVLTVIWFIITTCWVIVTFSSTTIRTKNFLTSSIILLTIGLLISFILSWIQIKHYNDLWEFMLNAWSNKTIEEIEDKAEDITKNITPWKRTKKFTLLSACLQIIWIIFFIIGLWFFMYSYN